MPKTSKFSANEDIWLTRAWVRASQDPVIGTQQTSDTFWSRIFEYWKVLHNQEAPGVAISDSRTPTSLNTRWRRHISADCKQMDAIRKRNPIASGENDERYLARCLSLYRDEHGKVFRFSGCLEHLKDVPIFNVGAHTGLSKRSREDIPQELWDTLEPEEGDARPRAAGVGTGSTTPDSVAVAVETVNLTLARPIGVKKAKKNVQQERQLQQQETKEKAAKDFSDSVLSLKHQMRENSLREYYLKMVERLEKKGGQEDKVEEFLEKLAKLDVPPDEEQEEEGGQERDDGAGTDGSDSSSAS